MIGDIFKALFGPPIEGEDIANRASEQLKATGKFDEQSEPEYL